MMVGSRYESSALRKDFHQAPISIENGSPICFRIGQF
jgi:hypothetical protein